MGSGGREEQMLPTSYPWETPTPSDEWGAARRYDF